MNARRRDDETGAVTDHDRIIRLEADLENITDNVKALADDVRDTLCDLNRKIDDLPSDKAIRLLVENEVNSAVEKIRLMSL